MGYPVDFKGSNVLVCGLARSGTAAARLLLSGGAGVTVSDSAGKDRLSPENLKAAAELEKAGAKLVLGENPDRIVGDYHYIVISPGIPIDTPFILKAQSLGVSVIGEVELGAWACPARIAAITGTNGKTSATTLAGDMLRRRFPGSETLGNIGTPFCEKAAGIPKNAWAALEISSFQLESINTFHPAIAAVLNITEDHLNRHYTMENYISVKERVFMNQTPADALVLNLDDPLCRTMAERARSKPAFFSVTDRGAPSDCHYVFLRDGAVYYRFAGYEERLWNASDMKVPFRHILEDAMAAALIAVIVGVPPGQTAETALAFGGVPHRVEHVARIGGVDYYNDSKATNADAAIKALTSLRGKVILIAGGMDKHADLSGWARLFKDKVKYLAVFGETSARIMDICGALGFTAAERVKGLREAVEAAASHAEPGDVVLFSPACASQDMYKNYEERGDLFKAYVLSLKGPGSYEKEGERP